MRRGLTPQQVEACAAPTVAPIMLIELDYAPEPVRLWTGIGTLAWGNRAFAGAGDLLGIGAIEESTEIRATTTTLSLARLPSEVLPHIDAINGQRVRATIWFGLLTDTGALLGEPWQMLRGETDVLTVREARDVAVSLTVENALADLDSSDVRYFTDADQQGEYPGDLGMQYVASLVEAEITL